MRSEEEPTGIREVLESLPKAKRRKIDRDTEMADMAAQNCAKSRRMRKEKGFGLEHPLNSLARKLPSWRKLEQLPGVYLTEYHTCMFHPSKRKKSQVLIHNRPILSKFLGVKCRCERICTRTKKKHANWRPKVRGGRVVSFPTGEEREYPREFCETYAACIKDLSNLDEEFTFLEVFSGPNAPLSNAVAGHLESELPPPMESLLGVDTDGTRIERSEHQSVPETLQPQSEFVPISAETGNKHRLEALESARQPSYGKRNQFIPDGLSCHLNIWIEPSFSTIPLMTTQV